MIYNNVIKKLVARYEKKIDAGLREASALAKDAARQGKLEMSECSETIRIFAGMSRVMEQASDPSNIQMAMNFASSASEKLNEESKKDS